MVVTIFFPQLEMEEIGFLSAIVHVSMGGIPYDIFILYFGARVLERDTSRSSVPSPAQYVAVQSRVPSRLNHG